MTTPPRVAVIIPAYNAARYIAGALGSVFAQTYTNFEVWVVNDGSPDTDAFEQALAPFAPRVRYVKQRNQGTAAARNNALRQTTAELVAFLDADDSWEPDYLEVQVAYLDTHPEIDLVYGDAVFVGGPASGKRFMEFFPSNGEVTFESLVSRRVHVVVSVLAKREAIIHCGMFCEAMQFEDMELWGRFLKAGYRIGYHRKPLLRYRRSAEAKSAETASNLRAEIAVYEKFRKDHSLEPAEAHAIETRLHQYRGELLLEEAKAAFRNKEFPVAAQKVDEANASLRRFRLRVIAAVLRLWPQSLYVADRMRGRTD